METYDFDKIVLEAKSHFQNRFGSHGWDHTERVLDLVLHIGRVEKADIEILKLATVLHDIGRHKESESLGEICHAEEGAKIAREILKSHGVDHHIVEQVIHCIENHRFRGDKKPESLEAKVLFDADKLDSIGAVGIGRAFLFAGEVKARLHNDPKIDIMKTKSYGSEDTAYREFMFKLRHIHERMLTKEGKRLAEARHKFMVDFFDRFCDEIRGNL